MNVFKETILRSDLLGAPTTLRSREQPFYESIFGGVISILTFIFFTVIFVLKLQDAFQLKLISYTEAQANSLNEFSSKIEQPVFSIDFPLLTKDQINQHLSVKMRIIDFAPVNRSTARRLSEQFPVESDRRNLQLLNLTDEDDDLFGDDFDSFNDDNPDPNECHQYEASTSTCFNQGTGLDFQCQYYADDYCYDSWAAEDPEDFEQMWKTWYPSEDEEEQEISEEQYWDNWFGFGVWKQKADMDTEQLTEFNFFSGSHTFGNNAKMRKTTLNVKSCPNTYYSQQGISDEVVDEQTSKCPSIGTTLLNNLKANSKIKIEINCKNAEGDGSCSADTVNFFNQVLDSQKSFPEASFLIMDTIFSPTSQTDYSKYINRVKKLEFDTLVKNIVNIQLSDYKVQTDTSFYPWPEVSTKSGYFVKDIDRYKLFTVGSANLVTIYIEKSQMQFQISRQYGKIDDLISYFGGLFGLLFVAVTFFAGSFNQIRYELMVANESFNSGTQDDQEEKFGVLKYVMYMLYDWLSFFNCQGICCWKGIRKINESRQESSNLLDVVSLQKRINYLQNCMDVLMTENQRLCMHFVDKPSIQQVRMKRVLTETIAKHIEKRREAQKEEIQAKTISQVANLMSFAQTLQNSQAMSKGQMAVDGLFKKISSLNKKSEAQPDLNFQTGDSFHKDMERSDTFFQKDLKLSEQQEDFEDQDLEKYVDVRIGEALNELMEGNSEICQIIQQKVSSSNSKRGNFQEKLKQALVKDQQPRQTKPKLSFKMESDLTDPQESQNEAANQIFKNLFKKQKRTRKYRREKPSKEPEQSH